MFASLADNDRPKDYPAFRLVATIIGTPLVLILFNTITTALVNTGTCLIISLPHSLFS
jgi:hypothetical protein